MVPFRCSESVQSKFRIRGEAFQLFRRNLQIHPINTDQPVYIVEISIHLPEHEYTSIEQHCLWTDRG